MRIRDFSFLHLPLMVRRELLSLVAMLLAAVVTAAATYLWYLNPAQERMNRAVMAYQEAKELEAKILIDRKAQEMVRRAQEQLNKVWHLLPKQDEFSSLALAISELGHAEHITIPGMSYTIDPNKQEGLPTKATLSFKASGKYDAMYRFIHRLESTNSYLVIESLDVTRAAKSSQASSTLIDVNVRVMTFLRATSPTRNMS